MFLPEYPPEEPDFRPTLEADNIGVIGERMLVHQAGQPSAALTVTPEVTPRDVEVIDERAHNHSFTEQLQQLLHRPDTLAPQLTPPDAYLLTDSSAIPIADSLRGLFDVQQSVHPLLGTIKAPKELRSRYWGQKSPQTFNRADGHEINRLEALLSGAAHVAIIEEVVFSGYSLAYACRLAFAAGVRNVSVVRGYWYTHVSQGDVYHQAISSRHRDAMYDIGRTAARLMSA